MTYKITRVLALAITCALLGCGEDDRGTPSVDGGGRDTGSPADGSTAAADAASTDAGSADGGPSSTDGIHIAFDYRFDTTGFFEEASRRRALEAAAAEIGARIKDDFPNVPAGTSIRVRNPETPSEPGMSFPIEHEIDDLLIFVGCASRVGGTARSMHTAALSSVTDRALQTALNERYRGDDFEPWTAWIAFHCEEPWFFDETPATDDDLPGTSVDFLSTAMHEMLHVLGFGTADAFAALVEGGSFTGARAVAAHGGPVPLTTDGIHADPSVTSDGQTLLMAPRRGVGVRRMPTSLELEIMADIGFEPVGR